MSKLLPDPQKIPVFVPLVPVFVCLAVFFAVLIKRGSMQLLEPAGVVAAIQSRILWAAIIFAGVAASLIISAFFFVAFRYKEGRRAAYQPAWTAGRTLQLGGWAVPLMVIFFLSGAVWISAHLVDPYRPIGSAPAPVTIQVVALQYKWLFIYPDDRLAAVNVMEIPAGTPVNLQLTADAPMNSFWIPRLSGQVYAMTGMVTQLHIKADKLGTYFGSPAEISGADFAGMNFTVKAVSAQDYTVWKTTASQSVRSLDYAAYTQLAKPSGYTHQALYTLPVPNLFQLIVMQFMVPGFKASSLDAQGGAS